MSQRNPSPPDGLESTMAIALNNNPSPSAPEILEAAERLLDRVLQTDCESRASALDLLTVDALITRALEIAARDPNLRERFPEEAMRRIASHAQA